MFSIPYTSHVLYEVDLLAFEKICRIIAGKTYLSDHPNISKPTLQRRILNLHQPKTNKTYALEGLMYECDEFVDERGFHLYMDPGEYSIIVVRIDQHNNYNIEMYVKHIYTEFLSYIF